MSEFRFKERPNPCPALAGSHQNPVTWVVEGYDPHGGDITWTPRAEGPVVGVGHTEGECHSTAEVTAYGLGMTQITATQGTKSVSAYVFVGDMLAYDAGVLHHAQSQFWLAERPPIAFADMKDHGIAWVARAEGAPCLVLNFQKLHEVRGDVVDALYFFTAEAGGTGAHEGSIPGQPLAYAYAPDGVTYWGIGADK